MKATDRLKSLEARTYQAAMLYSARGMDGLHGESYAAIICALGEYSALKSGCAELTKMAAAYYERPESDFTGGENPGDLSDSLIVTLLLWDVFQCTPRAWRLPGAEAVLIEGLRNHEEVMAGMDNKAAKAFLDSEIERVVRIKENEPENPTAKT
jgi:hypothetical protein